MRYPIIDIKDAGAFMELYRPIGKDPVVKDLSPDADLDENMYYVLRACVYCENTDGHNFDQMISKDDIIAIADTVKIDIDGKVYHFAPKQTFSHEALLY